MSNKTFDILKWIAQVFLPALTTLYGVIGATFNIPYTQEVLTIMVAVDTFLGTLLGISSAKYNSTKDDLEWIPMNEDGDDGK